MDVPKMNEWKTQICTRCGQSICAECRFQNGEYCNDCKANVCDSCLRMK